METRHAAIFAGFIGLIIAIAGFRGAAAHVFYWTGVAIFIAGAAIYFINGHFSTRASAILAVALTVNGILWIVFDQSTPAPYGDWEQCGTGFFKWDC